ncbi:MAG: chemotaxis protein CheW [Bacillota bacterium]|nr:chemotaxis protein CheW [Bacillota bacterium]
MAVSQYIVIELGDQEFALEILNVGSINEYQKITLLPNAPSYIEGVIDLRGDIIPIINLSERFNIESKKMLKEKRIIVIEIEEKLIGFLVDEASQAIAVDSADVKPTPDIIRNIDGDYIKGVCKLSDKILLLIDFAKILDHNQIEEIKNMELGE